MTWHWRVFQLHEHLSYKAVLNTFHVSYWVISRYLAMYGWPHCQVEEIRGRADGTIYLDFSPIKRKRHWWNPHSPTEATPQYLQHPGSRAKVIVCLTSQTRMVAHICNSSAGREEGKKIRSLRSSLATGKRQNNLDSRKSVSGKPSKNSNIWHLHAWKKSPDFRKMYYQWV